MRVPAVLDMQGLVVPLTKVRTGLSTRGQEVPHTMVLGGLPIQVRAVRVTQVPEGRVTRARAEQDAGVPLYADDAEAWPMPPNSGFHGDARVAARA